MTYVFFIISIPIILVVVVLVFFFIIKSLKTSKSKFSSVQTMDKTMPLSLSGNMLYINRNIRVEELDINTIEWIHSEQSSGHRSTRFEFDIWFHRHDGKCTRAFTDLTWFERGVSDNAQDYYDFIEKIRQQRPSILISRGDSPEEYKRCKQLYESRRRTK